MNLADSLRHIDRIFHAATAAAAPSRTLTAIAALATAASVHAQTTYYVDDDAPAGGDGSSWQTAFRDLRDALFQLELHYQYRPIIKIAAGVYRPDHGTGNRSASFRVTASATTLMGGFAGLGHANPDLHDPSSFTTILSGDLNGDDGPGFTNRSDNTHHVVLIEDAYGSQLSDLLIRGGNAEYLTGGGIQLGTYSARHLYIRNCTITDNLASSGAGIAGVSGSAVLLIESRVDANRAEYSGGGISVPHVELWWTRLHGNSLATSGGAGSQISSDDLGGTITIEQSIIDAAGQSNRAGAIAAYGPVLLRGSSLITGDKDAYAFTFASPAIIAGSIIASGENFGCPLARYRLTSLAVSRSVLHIQDTDLRSQAVTAIVGPVVAFGNPYFASASGPDGLAETFDDNDFRLRSSSPAIDLSDDAWRIRDSFDMDADGDELEPAPFDLSRAPRLHDDPGTPNLGLGSGGALDAGPYEFQGSSCRADTDASGLISGSDVFTFLTFYFPHSPDADFNRSGDTDVHDVFDYLAAYFTGCP